ncbi:Het-C-domain-containing protein [Morchella conica CCBAS932]|uniref:Het-C-domain-containing protein n=1 Tax=Morchella conica CCBAS932 TaxID=1392247 RepID=A0A3N4KT82_9PEZI|nr:Het-C-domain-containing protein [Morchella conica CCBAS932]
MPSLALQLLLCAGLVLCFTTPVAAFGAGNIINVSQIAGKNWRHGDIEDILLELMISASGGTRFDKLAVKRVYFGNWLRDYSQAIDVGGLKQLPKDTIRILLWVLSFVTFGFATAEFEVTEERLGCYRPEEHIDNPKDYADNEDARKYDSRLRGPVDEGKELAIDDRTGLKVYIASEDRGCDTSAGLVRKKFIEAIEKGRAYGRDGNNNDLYEALRLLGTGLHCLEDYAAHSNYIELALREMGIDAFPHVGENTEIEINGKRIFPLVTGTFGMTDFLHSVVGEVSDKVAQSEVQELDAKLAAAEQQSQDGGTTSTLKGILDNIPFGLLGLGDSNFGDQASKIQDDANNKQSDQGEQSKRIAGMDVNELKTQAAQTMKEIYPIMEFHDKVMKAMSQAIDKIPGASELLENLTGAMQIFIFSMLAPYVKPILNRVKTELAAGSGGVLQASENAQFNVFEDGNSSDPTHSVLSKDHFTNILNEVAGRVATESVKFAVPLIVAGWEDSNRDANQICDEILQIFHHPALRDENKQGQRAMFEVVQNWWNEKDDGMKQHFTEALSKQGVREGKNHEGEDPNPGPGGCGHSHGGMGGRQNHGQSSGGYNAPSRSLETNEGSYGGSSNRNRYNQEESYGSGGGYGSSNRDRNEEQSYGGGYGSSNRENTGETYGGSGGYGSSNRNREETSSYGGGGGYGSSNRNRGNDETTSYGGGGGGYGGNNEDVSGSSARHWGGEDTSTSYSASREESSYSRNEESSSYGRDNQASYETSSRNRGNEDTYGSRNTGGYGSSYGGNNREEESSYGGGRDNQASYETSSRNRGNEDTYGSGNTGGYGSSYGGNNREEESSYGGGRDNETSSYNRGGEETGYGRQSSSRYQEGSYGNNNEGEEDSYGRRVGGGYGQDEQSGGGRGGYGRSSEY